MSRRTPSSGTKRLIALAALACLAAIAGAGFLFAAGSGSGEAPVGIPSRFIAKVPGTSGWKWVGGDRESPFMHPGLDCIGCHARGEGPRFFAAGTVYQKMNENNDILGVPGLVVALTDANGSVQKLETNAAGNFSLRDRGSAMVFPLSAKVVWNGKERAMGSPLTVANCMLCHTAAGTGGAPGRIIVP